MSGDCKHRGVRATAGLLIISAILVVFLYQQLAEGQIQSWLVVLVSVLGLTAAAAILGTDALETASKVLKGFRGGGR